MSKLWPYLEVAAGCMAPAVTWQEWLGSEWEVVRTALMGRRPDGAASLPCPRGGEPHAVITHDEDDIVAVPDGESCTCDDQAVTAEQVKVCEVSTAKLGLALAKALELQPRDGDTGIAGVREVGAFSGQAVPVFLILARDGEAFRAAVSELVARQRKAFGLLAPTNRHYGARCRELMEGCGAVFVDLETNIEITKAGALQAKTAPGELLKGLLAKDGEATVDRRKETEFRPRYLLRKGLKSWRLVFDGEETVLPDEKGVHYVAELLKNPPEKPLHVSELAARAFGDAVIEGQRNLALDDAETYAEMQKSRGELQAVLDDKDASAVEKNEAEKELAEIDEWARKYQRGTEAGEQQQVRAVRAAIRRLLEDLEDATGERNRPNQALRNFGKHLDNYLWKPSSGSGRGRNAQIKSGMAGRFTYLPPAGVKWSG